MLLLDYVMQRHGGTMDSFLWDGVSMELPWLIFWQYACGASVSDSNEIKVQYSIKKLFKKLFWNQRGLIFANPSKNNTPNGWFQTKISEWLTERKLMESN